MSEINLKFTVTIPGLPELIEALKGLGGIQTPTAPTAPIASAVAGTQSTEMQYAQIAPQEASAVISPTPMAVVPTPLAVEPAAPTPMAPTVQTTAVTYTADDLARAGVTLVDAGRQADLQALLAKYGVDSLPALNKAQYGAFATDLRQMGAQI